MNRTLLLENLPDLLEDLDAHLTALEAAEPQAQIERLLAENRRLTDGFYALEAQRRALTAELSAMKQRRDALAAELGDRIKERKTIWAEVDDLKAQRNALAAQLDDLRNVNAGLRQDNALMMADKRQLRAALEAVEYDGEYGTCLWCSSLYGYEHFQNCQRQAALR